MMDMDSLVDVLTLETINMKKKNRRIKKKIDLNSMHGDKFDRKRVEE